MKPVSTLQIAFGISVAVQAALPTVRSVNPERFDRVFQNTPLDVILAKDKSDDQPDKATALAQASLAGGSELEKGRATSPVLPSARIELDDDKEEQAQQKIASLKAEQTQLLLHVKQALSAMPLSGLNMSAQTPSQTEQQKRRKKLVKRLAEMKKTGQRKKCAPQQAIHQPGHAQNRRPNRGGAEL